MTVSEAQKVELQLAEWDDRFVAWLIDFVLIEAAIWVLFSIISIPFIFTMFMMGSFQFAPFQFFPFGLNALIFLAYWTYFDHILGASIGKQLMGLKIVDANGRNLTSGNALLESIGKSFLLPIDVLIGLIAFAEKRQRLFSRMVDATVVKIPLAERRGGVRFTAESKT